MSRPAFNPEIPHVPHDQREPLGVELNSPERRAVAGLIEQADRPGWGIGFFEHQNGRLTMQETGPDGTIRVRIGVIEPGQPDGAVLMPYQDRPESRRAGAGGSIELIDCHLELLERTGVFGRVAALGRDGYHQARLAAERDDLVATARFRRMKRNQYAKRAGDVEWRDRLVGNGIEDWVVVRSEDDQALMQSRLEWYYRIDTDTNELEIKRLRRNAVRERAGIRNFAVLAEPYLTQVPPEVELIWNRSESQSPRT